jgi:hypothetical protein
VSLRLASVPPLFRSGGFDLGRSWTAFEQLSPVQVETLRVRHGRWIRVHPEDRGELARYGLRYVAATGALDLVAPATAPPPPPPPPPPSTPTSTKSKGAKPDDKKA